MNQTVWVIFKVLPDGTKNFLRDPDSGAVLRWVNRQFAWAYCIAAGYNPHHMEIQEIFISEG